MRPHGLRVLVGIALIAAGVLVPVPSPAPASAAFLHTYSVGIETNDNLGGSMNRSDTFVTVPGGVCAADFVAPVVYEPLWVAFPPSGGQSRWLEVGTMNKTATCKYWYWWAYSPDIGRHFGVIGQVPNGSHSFVIVRGPSGWTWQIVIDNVLRAELGFFGGQVATEVHAGLESYESTATTPVKAAGGLRTFGGTQWWWFDGRQVLRVDTTMCGRYIQDTAWRYSQNASC